MSSIVEKLAAQGHLSPNQVERIGRNVSDFMKAAKADPKLLKQANFGKVLTRTFEQGVPVMLGAAAMGLGASLAGKAYEGISGAVTKASDYKKMMEANPNLKQYDNKQVQQAFNTLHKFNPTYASDPLVAGTFVRNAAERERIDVQEIHGLVQSRRHMAESIDKGKLLKPTMAALPITGGASIKD